MRKITAKEAKAGMKVSIVGELHCRIEPTITIGKTDLLKVRPGREVTILASPKSYSGSGRCVTFKIKGVSVILYAWWTDFKKSTRYKDKTIKLIK